jgi:hypothetical protein
MIFGSPKLKTQAPPTAGGSTVMTRRSATDRTLAPGPNNETIGDGRRPSANATATGRTAQPRVPGAPEPPALPTDASGQARAAGMRQRKRGAGSSILSGLPVTGGGSARVRTRTLLGY